MGIYSSLLLSKKFSIIVSADTAASYLSSYQNENFDVQKLSDTEYKTLSHFSMGVGRMGAKMAEGINIQMTLKPLDNSTTEVTLTSKLRIELVLFSIISLLALFYMLNSPEKLPTWVIALPPAALVWFWFVYRFQEHRLALKVERYLLSLS